MRELQITLSQIDAEFHRYLVAPVRKFLDRTGAPIYWSVLNQVALDTLHVGGGIPEVLIAWAGAAESILVHPTAAHINIFQIACIVAGELYTMTHGKS